MIVGGSSDSSTILIWLVTLVCHPLIILIKIVVLSAFDVFQFRRFEGDWPHLALSCFPFLELVSSDVQAQGLFMSDFLLGYRPERCKFMRLALHTFFLHLEESLVASLGSSLHTVIHDEIRDALQTCCLNFGIHFSHECVQFVHLLLEILVQVFNGFYLHH